jgi:S1-C subfamily serine protease
VSAQLANREEVERQAWEQHLTAPEPQEIAAPAAESEGGESSPASSVAGTVHGNSFIGTTLMNPAYTGAMLETLSAQLADYFGVPGGMGLLVRSVDANSPAALAGMRAGDVVVRANAQPLASANDWAKAIKNSKGHSLTVVVLRDKKEQTLTLTPDAKKRSSVEEPADGQAPGAVAHLGFSWMPAVR